MAKNLTPAFHHRFSWQSCFSYKIWLDKRGPGILLCPLGIGNHINHGICREAVPQLYKKMKVIFFEDFPYANRITETQIKLHIEELAKRLGVEMTNFTTSLLNCAMNKEHAIRLYKTQLNDEICSEIISHMQLLSGERLWGEPPLLNEFRSLVNCS